MIHNLSWRMKEDKKLDKNHPHIEWFPMYKRREFDN
jgi:thiaminase